MLSAESPGASSRHPGQPRGDLSSFIFLLQEVELSRAVNVLVFSEGKGRARRVGSESAPLLNSSLSLTEGGNRGSQLRAGKTPCKAMQKFKVRYGIMLLWGRLPPAMLRVCGFIVTRFEEVLVW